MCEEDGGDHDWVTGDELYALREAEEARRQAEETRRQAERKAEEAERTRPIREYHSFLNSAAGKEQLVKIASGYMSRHTRASIWYFILGLISIAGFLVGCIAFAGLLKSEKILSLPLLVGAISFSLSVYFYRSFKRSLKERSELLPRVVSRETGFAVPFMDAAKFLASRDISRNFEYKDEYGNLCTPEPFVPDISNTEVEWQQKMEHAGKLDRRRRWAKAAREYTKIGNECGVLNVSASAWSLAANCYNILDDERAPACYRNAVRGYKKLASQGDEDAQEKLAEAERQLAKFLNRNAQGGNE
jgi:hypothetical protein